MYIVPTTSDPGGLVEVFRSLLQHTSRGISQTLVASFDYLYCSRIVALLVSMTSGCR